MKKKYKFDKLKLTYILIALLVLFIPNYNQISIKWLSQTFSFLSIIQLILGCYIWHKKNKNLNHPYIYFIFSCYICWFGQILFCALGIKTVNEVVIESFEPSLFLNTCKYALLSFSFLFLGGICFSKKEYVDIKLQGKKIENKDFHDVVTTLSFLMILLSIIPHYYNLISTLITSFSDGYFNIFGNNYSGIFRSIYNIFSSLEMFFWPGMFLLLVSNLKNKRVFYSFVILMIFDILILFSIGTRSEAIALILAFVWMYTTLYKKINKKIVCFGIVFGIFFLRLLSVIFVFRTSSDRTLIYFVQLFFSLPIGTSFEILREFGFNIFSLYHTIRLVPSTQNYSFGLTYIASIMAVIPSLLMGGFSFSNYAALPEWLMKKLNLSYGPGYSILAESYYNFGYFGFACMFAIGVIMVKSFSNNKKGDYKIIYTAFVATMLFANAFMARDTFLMFFRNYLYLVLIPYALIRYMIKNTNAKFTKSICKLMSPILKILNGDNINQSKVIFLLDSNASLYNMEVQMLEKKFNQREIEIQKVYLGCYNWFKRYMTIIRSINSRDNNTIVYYYNGPGYFYTSFSEFINKNTVLLVNKNDKSSSLRKDKNKFDYVINGNDSKYASYVADKIMEGCNNG